MTVGVLATPSGAEGGVEEGGDNDDDDDDDDDDEGAGRKKGGKPKKGGGAKGKKGGGKKGGKKRPGGDAAAAAGGGSGRPAEEAAAEEATDPDRLEVSAYATPQPSTFRLCPNPRPHLRPHLHPSLSPCPRLHANPTSRPRPKSHQVQLLWPLSAAGGACAAPVLRCEGVAAACLIWPLGLEDIVYARRATPLAAALSVLQASLVSRAEALVAAVPRGGATPRAALGSVPKAVVFHPAALPTAVSARLTA